VASILQRALALSDRPYSGQWCYALPSRLRGFAARSTARSATSITSKSSELNGLRRSAPFLKARLARMIELRHVPNIAFAFDNAFDSAARISALASSGPANSQSS